MRIRLTPALVSFSIIALGGTHLHAQENRELDSHEHGHVKMEIAIEKNKMNIAVEAPGESIVGFEHAAKTDAQKAAVAAAQKQLSDPAAIFELPSQAGCTVESASAELHQHGGHNEFEASYAFTCTDIEALKTVETKLFSLYPAIDEIDVDYVVPGGQGSVELEPDAPTVKF